MTAFLLILVISNSLIHYNTHNKIERVEEGLELQLARQQYLHECDLCDVYSKPGSTAHETCILRATHKWEYIKLKRGWE